MHFFKKIKLRCKEKQTLLKFAALFLCVLIITISLFSSIYIFENINHTHNQNGPDGACSTCIHLQAAENLLVQLGTGVIIAIFIIGGFFTLHLVTKLFYRFFSNSTPISLKVRLTI